MLEGAKVIGMNPSSEVCIYIHTELWRDGDGTGRFRVFWKQGMEHSEAP